MKKGDAQVSGCRSYWCCVQYGSVLGSKCLSCVRHCMLCWMDFWTLAFFPICPLFGRLCTIVFAVPYVPQIVFKTLPGPAISHLQLSEWTSTTPRVWLDAVVCPNWLGLPGNMNNFAVWRNVFMGIGLIESARWCLTCVFWNAGVMAMAKAWKWLTVWTEHHFNVAIWLPLLALISYKIPCLTISKYSMYVCITGISMKSSSQCLVCTWCINCSKTDIRNMPIRVVYLKMVWVR